ncbi:MAG: cell division protein FtsA [Legionellales bacterium]|nr:MAG: cell division protein FtsA [Legionellales bacterium]
MLKKTGRNLLVGLDIGTHKIAAVVGEIDKEGNIKVIGVGNSAACGLKKGTVVNIDAAVTSIQHAVEDAELMAGCEIHSVYTGIANTQVRSFNSHGVVAIETDEVSEADIERVVEAARAVAVPADQKILHVLPQDFIVDGQEGIQAPVGMAGVRLEAKVHMVISAVSAAQNIVKCVRRCGLDVDDLMLKQLASSYATLTQDEQQLGTCLIDIGAGTTSIAVYVNDAIKHTAVIPVAGMHVSNDIAVALRIPIKQAEAMKVQYAAADISLLDADIAISAQGVGDREPRSIDPAQLTEVVVPRYEEIFQLVQKELHKANLEHALGSGVVLTGGAAKLPGLINVAESIFNVPVRIAAPQNISGSIDIISDPAYATGVGLLMYGHKMSMDDYRGNVDQGGLQSFWGKIKNWLQGNF